MAKKADLESSFRAVQARFADAAQAEGQADFPAALAHAEACLPDLRGYMAYLKRYRGIEAPGLPSVELIFRLAPPMFATRAFAAVDAWLAEASRAERKAYPHLPADLELARDRLTLATRLWPAWRITPVTAPTAEAGQLLDVWVVSGAVARVQGTNPPSYELVTYPSRPAVGKCCVCGTRVEGPWVEFLAPKPCTRCRAATEFVLMPRSA